MDKRREHRYATMEDLAADLHRLSVGAVPVALPDRMARGSIVNTAPPWSGMPVPVPGMPPSSARKTALVMGGSFLAVLALAGVTSVLLHNSSTSNATSNATSNGAGSAATVGSVVRDPQVIPPPALVASAASVASTKQVTVKVVPDSAKVSRNGALLTAPYVFDVGPTDSIALSAAAPGYKPLDITVDASNLAPVYKLTATGSGVDRPRTPSRRRQLRRRSPSRRRAKRSRDAATRARIPGTARSKTRRGDGYGFAAFENFFPSKWYVSVDGVLHGSTIGSIAALASTSNDFSSQPTTFSLATSIVLLPA